MSVYTVERIEGKREFNGIVEYNIKWSGYPRSQNTWEPAHHLYCTDLIAEFRKSEKNKLSKTQSTAGLANKKQKRKVVDKNMPYGFQNGLQPSKIIGATGTLEKLMLIMTYKKSNFMELVPAKIANIRCPQIVIKFYEERLTWINEEEIDD